MIVRVMPMVLLLAAVLACDPIENADATGDQLRVVIGADGAAPARPLDIIEPPTGARLGHPDASFDMACFGPLSHLARCFVACNQWVFDGEVWTFAGALPCRFACVDLKTQHVLSCGHYCDDADDCWLAYFDQDLTVYPGEPIPASLVDAFEDIDPYADVPIASAWFNAP